MHTKINVHHIAHNGSLYGVTDANEKLGKKRKKEILYFFYTIRNRRNAIHSYAVEILQLKVIAAIL